MKSVEGSVSVFCSYCKISVHFLIYAPLNSKERPDHNWLQIIKIVIIFKHFILEISRLQTRHWSLKIKILNPTNFLSWKLLYNEFKDVYGWNKIYRVTNIIIVFVYCRHLGQKLLKQANLNRFQSNGWNILR